MKNWQLNLCQFWSYYIASYFDVTYIDQSNFKFCAMWTLEAPKQLTSLYIEIVLLLEAYFEVELKLNAWSESKSSDSHKPVSYVMRCDAISTLVIL